MNDLQAQLEEVNKEKQELQEKVGSTEWAWAGTLSEIGGTRGTQTPAAPTMGRAEQSYGELPVGMGTSLPAVLLQDRGACGQG